MSVRSISLSRILFCIFCFTHSICLYAQDAENKDVTAELLQSRIQAAESSQDLSDQVRAFVVDKYKQTLSELQTKKTLQSRLEQLQIATDEAKDPNKGVATLQRAIDSLPKEPTIDVGSAETADAAEEELTKKKIDLDAAKNVLKSLDDETRRRPERRTQIPQINAEKQQFIDREAESPPFELPAAFADARKILRDVQLQNAQLEIQIGTKELEYFEADKELLPLRREKAQREVTLLEKAVESWTTRAAELRADSISQQKQVAESSEVAASKELARLAKSNLELVSTRKRIADGLANAKTAFDKSTELVEKHGVQLENIKKQLGSQATVSEAVGTMLIKDRKELPDIRKLRRDSIERKAKLYDAQFALVRTEVELAEFGNMERRVEQENNKLLEDNLNPERVEELQSELTTLLQARQEILQKLKDDYESYVGALGQLDVKEDSLINIIEEYTEFVDERVLWIRSAPPVSWKDAGDLAEAIAWLASASRWRGVLNTDWRREFGHPVANLAYGVGLLMLVVYRVRFRQHVNELGRQAESKVCQNFSITIEVLIFTLARSAIWPLVFYWAAWNLSHLDERVAFARPLVSSLKTIAIVSYPVMFWSRAVRPHGLAEAHLNWSTQQRNVTMASLRLLFPIIVPAIGLFEFFEESGNVIYEKSAGRLCLIVATMAMAWCVGKLLSPSTGVFAQYLSLHRGGWLDRLKGIWYPAVLLIPVSFVLLALMGYQYTAAELLQRFYVSAAFLSGMYLLEAVGRRWLLISHRRLAIQQARKRLAQVRATANEPVESSSSVETLDVLDGVTESTQVDLSAVSTQSKRLFGSITTVAAFVGLYAIWIAVLPALAKLDDYQLWPISSAMSDAVAVPDSDSAVGDSGGPPIGVSPQGITLGNLITSCVVLFMTSIAAQNIPGLMEIALLQRLPLDVAVRYAIKTVTRYVIIIVGVASAFSAIGIGWSKIQWLVAAVSVGLGFGLQEIFANFVSGLILLFERPLRAGDIVTVGQVSGRVVQIKTRATTIRDWDCKELIVPNKEFITGQLLNWTLSNTVNRVVINVGIAYGADIKQVRSIVLDVAHQHPLISDDPAPSVTFEAFGDSTLNFTLRCYLPNLDNRLDVIHELHEAIHDRLRVAGIEIPFPQRDIHVRSIDGTVVVDAGKEAS